MKGINETQPREFDIFIEGEVVDLCVPNNDPWVIDQWYRWFNDPTTTKFLRQGVFPNTVEKQKRFYESLLSSDERIALLIKPKKGEYFVGVASLSSIDFQQRQCDFAMVIGKRDNTPDSLFYAMEAKCRMTEHAFENIGVERINSGQVMELIRWQKWQILFGYQIEGIQRRRFRRGNKVWDVMVSSCLVKDYFRLKDMRNGAFWPGKARLFELMKRLPGESTIEKLEKWLAGERDKNWQFLTEHTGRDQRESFV